MGFYICRGSSERTTVRAARERCLAEMSARRKVSTCHSDRKLARGVVTQLGDYGLAALPELCPSVGLVFVQQQGNIQTELKLYLFA